MKKESLISHKNPELLTRNCWDRQNKISKPNRYKTTVAATIAKQSNTSTLTITQTKNPLPVYYKCNVEHKMITRRNWLLRCSIFINIAVALYICSHVMIGSGNMTLGPAFIIQEDYTSNKQPMRPHAVASLLQSIDPASSYEQPSPDKDTVQVSPRYIQHN